MTRRETHIAIQGFLLAVQGAVVGWVLTSRTGSFTPLMVGVCFALSACLFCNSLKPALPVSA